MIWPSGVRVAYVMTLLYSTDSTSVPGQMMPSLMSSPSVIPAPALVLPARVQHHQ